MSQTIPNFDASFCGRLPLHQTNLIQPHGVLFVLDAAALEVLQVSENIDVLPSLDAQTVAGKSFESIADAASFNQLQQIIGSNLTDKQMLSINLMAGSEAIACSASVHQKEGLLFLELLLPQYAQPAGRSFLNVYQDVKNIMTALEAQKDVHGFAETVAKEMRRLSGFDKVLVYSFDKDDHGTVLAEEKVAEMDAYLGLRFPASDIPKPARDLYLKNPYRFIPNCNYQPARLYPLLNPLTNAFSDLSSCDLRSVAGVHLEYLRNMQITASMSLRLVHNGRLWGLISCHNREAHYCSFEELGLYELLTGIFSAQLSLVLNNRVGQEQQHLQTQLTSLVPRLNAADDLYDAISDNASDLMSLLNADGLAYSIDGQLGSFGTVPDESDLDRLFYWLQVQDGDGLTHLPSLTRSFEEAAHFSNVASGILSLPVVPQQGAFVVAFRPEEIEEVSWGGNPHEALQVEGDGKTYHPRNSFKIWKQTVQNTSRSWSEAELNIADALKNVLAGMVIKRLHA
ncbi:GAF domain-containing protein [Paracnuella aquatica]|uniref:GAF domain-containing protein n=1 Tax=Paracnuella aquatica TaxID=2268757 RepID=UPI000DF010C3|nr:GAF domain-containing protein [Paracnuella aquatica]RPD51898.1 GAF domain-containing protein [Paracnuella aquatica]